MCKVISTVLAHSMTFVKAVIITSRLDPPHPGLRPTVGLRPTESLRLPQGSPYLHTPSHSFASFRAFSAVDPLSFGFLFSKGSKLYGGQKPCLFCQLLFRQHLVSRLAHSRCSVATGLNEGQRHTGKGSFRSRACHATNTTLPRLAGGAGDGRFRRALFFPPFNFPV